MQSSKIFALTVFISAALIFTVEPLIGKILLPLAGGTPAVWTTCLLFFQAALLAGYAYAHGLTDRLNPKAQVIIHVIVIAIPLVALPFDVDKTWFVGTSMPVASLLIMLAKTVGLSFFALTTTAPLIQRWFANTEPTGDPYPLYAASNAGSLLGLAAYPFLIEPGIDLTGQRKYWAIGYGVFVLLVAACGAIMLRTAPNRIAAKEKTTSAGDPWLRWLLLSFAPSSLLMSVTTAVTTDITPVPLLWVVPLALYLLTFIIAFAGRQYIPHKFVVLLAPIASLALFFVILNKSDRPWTLVLSIHLVVFFIISLACHGELSRLKPPADRLTKFFLIVSAGGVLGGILNAVIAPIIFRKIGLAEYPLVLCLAVGLMPDRPRSAALKGILEPTGIKALTYPLIVGAVTVIGVLVARVNGLSDPVVGMVLLGLPLIFIYLLVDRPKRFGLATALVWVASLFHVGSAGPTLDFERNFFGIVKVTSDRGSIVIAKSDPMTGRPFAEHAGDEVHSLIHGSTLHGKQIWNENKGVNEPLTYYGRPGPIGDVFKFLDTKDAKPVAVCGLGAGSLASYVKPKQPWTFYEIDPAIIRIANDSKMFTFLSDNFPNKDQLTIALGDARLEMAKAAKGAFGLIVLDAFSSDSIPIHLLTREALGMYEEKLAPGGIIAIHISNRYLDLKPVLGLGANDLKMVTRVRDDIMPSEEEKATGRMSSSWVIIARTDADLGPMATGSGWKRLPAIHPKFRMWTDDYSNILSVFQFTDE
jgi:hypothetical protein